ncbi:hypothetical protein LT493_18845 [Streptomyces tricolor]|nr:hypothetical protein [Streptomyces tricolor]
MHHHDPFAARVCPHCDGFATVAVDAGARDRHGQRITVLTDCPACWGWGGTPVCRAACSTRRPGG